MTVRVVPLEATDGQLKFDVIIENGYAKTFFLDTYAIRQYRGASISDIIEQKVLDYLQEMGHNVDSVSIIFC